MKVQNYKNHVRYYPAHHFVFYPAAGILMVISLVYLFERSEQFMIWFVLSGVILLVIGLSFMLRQHYALINQNRLIRLELRFRYFVLTQKRFEIFEESLSEPQIRALRFAPDSELATLVDRTLTENLSADMIKQSIKNWLPDNIRV